MAIPPLFPILIYCYVPLNMKQNPLTAHPESLCAFPKGILSGQSKQKKRSAPHPLPENADYFTECKAESA